MNSYKFLHYQYNKLIRLYDKLYKTRYTYEKYLDSVEDLNQYLRDQHKPIIKADQSIIDYYDKLTKLKQLVWSKKYELDQLIKVEIEKHKRDLLLVIAVELNFVNSDNDYKRNYYREVYNYHGYIKDFETVEDNFDGYVKDNYKRYLDRAADYAANFIQQHPDYQLHRPLTKYYLHAWSYHLHTWSTLAEYESSTPITALTDFEPL